MFQTESTLPASMASTNSNSNYNSITEFPPMPSPSTPAPSTPFQLRGFLTGDTVQLQGDTGELQFSVQFNVHRKDYDHHQSGDCFNSPEKNSLENESFENESFHDCVQSSSPSPSPSYLLTPTSSTPQNQDCNEDAIESFSRGEIVTRLRSGVLSPVSYNRGRCYGVLSSGSRKKASKGKKKADNVFDKMLKRRSLPIRPCNAYAFFLMDNWGVIKSFSFGETSKMLSKKWYKLSHDKKKVYEDMALKDNARYQRQCVLLKNDIEQETGLQVDSD